MVCRWGNQDETLCVLSPASSADSSLEDYAFSLYTTRIMALLKRNLSKSLWFSVFLCAWELSARYFYTMSRSCFHLTWNEIQSHLPFQHHVPNLVISRTVLSGITECKPLRQSFHRMWFFWNFSQLLLASIIHSFLLLSSMLWRHLHSFKKQLTFALHKLLSNPKQCELGKSDLNFFSNEIVFGKIFIFDIYKNT